MDLKLIFEVFMFRVASLSDDSDEDNIKKDRPMYKTLLVKGEYHARFCSVPCVMQNSVLCFVSCTIPYSALLTVSIMQVLYSALPVQGACCSVAPCSSVSHAQFRVTTRSVQHETWCVLPA